MVFVYSVVLVAIICASIPGVGISPPLPHSQRTSLRCLSTVIDDEAHCLFMCEHPTIVEAGDSFLAAVVLPVAALSSLRYADLWALSATGGVPLAALVKYRAVCARVCWGCHQFGGTDEVDLPDILLPAGLYLDRFDSESDHSECLLRLMRNWLKFRWVNARVLRTLGWWTVRVCLPIQLILVISLMTHRLTSPSWLPAWVFVLVGALERV